MKTRPYSTMVDREIRPFRASMYKLYTWTRANIHTPMRPAQSSSSLADLLSSGHVPEMPAGMDYVVTVDHAIVRSSGAAAETIARRVRIAA